MASHIETNLIDVSDDTIDSFAFERSIYDCSILHDKFCHSSAWLYSSFADFENLHAGRTRQISPFIED
jgi:hypothetical protein